jgi:hypothetical protein
MSDSTRRAARTVYQLVISLIAVIPVLAGLGVAWEPAARVIAALIGFGAIATKLINALEDKGLIPAWLKAPASDGANPVG